MSRGPHLPGPGSEVHFKPGADDRTELFETAPRRIDDLNRFHHRQLFVEQVGDAEREFGFLPAIHRQRVGGRDVVVETRPGARSEEHTSELQSLMRISYAVFCLKKKNHKKKYT